MVLPSILPHRSLYCMCYKGAKACIFTRCVYTGCVCFSYQQTVEKDVAKHSQTANDEVNEVVEELKVQHHGFIATREGSSVAHKTYQEDDFVTHLENKVTLFFLCTIYYQFF